MGKGEEGDIEMMDGEEEEGFEVMKTPFERVLEEEDRPKVRCMPTLTLYLSRVRIESLKKLYGYVNQPLHLDFALRSIVY